MPPSIESLGETAYEALLAPIWDFLVRTHAPAPSDVIFVFGSRDLGVARRAAELYAAGLSFRVLVSGLRGPLTERVFDKPEALVFKDELTRLGVPYRAITTEVRAGNTLENVRFGMTALAAAGQTPCSAMLVALWLAARRPAAAASDVSEPPPVAARPVVLAAIALSGFASLGAEVVWTRQLSLLFGATVYNFSLILAVFLAGIGVGSPGGVWLAKRTGRADLALAWCQLALLAALPYGAYMIGYQIPFWQVGEELLPWVGESRPLLFLYDIARCAVSIGPATLFWGASFPLALAAANCGESDAARLVARVSVVNTLGALAGTVVFSLVVIPGLGTQRAQQALALVAATAAVLMFLTATRRIITAQPLPAAPAPVRGSRLRLAWLTALVVLATLTSLWAAVPSTPNGLIAFGRDILGWDTIERYLYVEEGVNASVAVTDSDGGYRQLHISGKVVASTMDLDMRIERMLGHVPALVHGPPAACWWSVWGRV